VGDVWSERQHGDEINSGLVLCCNLPVLPDIADAVLDSSDALVLSEGTAIGSYAAEATEMMVTRRAPRNFGGLSFLGYEPDWLLLRLNPELGTGLEGAY
jgi:hypothetical protein